VQEHVVDLPWLQRVHEGEGSARRPLHHEPHLRDLRRQPRDVLGVRAEHGLRDQDAADGGDDLQPRRSRRVHVRPRDLPGQPGVRRLLRADGRRDEPERAEEGERNEGAARRHPRVQDDRGHPPLVQSVRGIDLQGSARDEPAHARDVLPDGGPARPSLHALPGRHRHRAHAAALRGSCGSSTS